MENWVTKPRLVQTTVMLFISVSNKKQNRQLEHRDGPFEFGRGPRGNVPRFVIEDGFVSRDHLHVEELPGDRLAVRNLSSRNPVLLPDGTEIPASGSRELPLPVSVVVGETSIVIRAKADAGATPTPTPAPAPTLETTKARPELPAAPPIPEAFAADGYLSLQPIRRQDSSILFPGLGEAPPPETLARWMETVLALQRLRRRPCRIRRPGGALPGRYDRPGRRAGPDGRRQGLAGRRPRRPRRRRRRPSQRRPRVQPDGPRPGPGQQADFLPGPGPDEVPGKPDERGRRRGLADFRAGRRGGGSDVRPAPRPRPDPGRQDSAAGGAAGAAAGRRGRRQPRPHGRHAHAHPVRAVLLAGVGGASWRATRPCWKAGLRK